MRFGRVMAVNKMRWTWTRIALLTAAAWLQIDAFIISTRADPGPAGDVALSFAIGWVALKNKVPSTAQAIVGCGLAGFSSVSNRANLRGYEFFSLPLVVLGCILFVNLSAKD